MALLLRKVATLVALHLRKVVTLVALHLRKVVTLVAPHLRKVAKLVAHLPKRALPLPARIHPIVTQMMTKRLAPKDLLRKEATPMVLPSRKEATLKDLLKRKGAMLKALLPKSPPAKVRPTATRVTIAMTVKALLKRNEANPTTETKCK